MTILESTIIEFDMMQHRFRILTLSEFELDLQNENLIYWVHCDLHQPHILDQLAQKLQLPTSLKEACHQKEVLPKAIETETALTIQVQALVSVEHTNAAKEVFDNLIIYLTNKYCFTASKQPLPAIIEFFENYPKALQFAKTPCFILFLILDNLVNNYAESLYALETKSEELDLKIRKPVKNLYHDVMVIKKKLMQTKRQIIAIREILMRISGRRVAVISEQCRQSLFNLSNHCQIVVNEMDAIRDFLNGLLDQIDNTLMQRMSESMKVLTAFAAIFLPLTLITGIYGMNFTWMPELHWHYGYFYALSLIIGCAIVMLIIFKRKKWF